MPATPSSKPIAEKVAGPHRDDFVTLALGNEVFAIPIGPQLLCLALGADRVSKGAPLIGVTWRSDHAAGVGATGDRVCRAISTCRTS